MQELINAIAGEERERKRAVSFCKQFCGSNRRPKFVFGCTIYAHDIVKSVQIDGFVDDLYLEPSFLGRPVIKSAAIPADALVVAGTVFRPLSMKARLEALGVESLDFFAFRRESGLELRAAAFIEGNIEDYRQNEAAYRRVYESLKDDLSRETFRKLLSFRVTTDIAHLAGFTLRDKEQYFEPFLNLRTNGETFVDVGGFDAYTSLQFVARCPGYDEVHLFEPELKNYDVCVEALKDLPRTFVHKMGLSDKPDVLNFSSSGSASQISDEGELSINVDRLDSVGISGPTFIKMDIEGAEKAALMGGAQTIRGHHPRLAIAAYHRPGDFWRIPSLVRSIRDDYTIYMRHYAESLYETVIFFIPNG